MSVQTPSTRGPPPSWTKPLHRGISLRHLIGREVWPKQRRRRKKRMVDVSFCVKYHKHAILRDRRTNARQPHTRCLQLAGHFHKTCGVLVVADCAHRPRRLQRGLAAAFADRHGGGGGHDDDEGRGGRGDDGGLPRRRLSSVFAAVGGGCCGCNSGVGGGKTATMVTGGGGRR